MNATDTLKITPGTDDDKKGKGRAWGEERNKVSKGMEELQRRAGVFEE